MHLTSYSLLAAFIMLIMGLLIYAILHRLVFPGMNTAYEKAKLSNPHARDPVWWMRALKAFHLAVFPLIGLLVGGPVVMYLLN